jgi:hypothetical protein
LGLLPADGASLAGLPPLLLHRFLGSFELVLAAAAGRWLPGQANIQLVCPA